ncbi:MAG: alanine racemase [bacterium]|nr:alanine racemase [bacterium]
MILQSPTTWIEVSRAALLHNAGRFRGALRPGQTLMPVLKANAYGHGLEEIGRLLMEENFDLFGLHTAEEVFRLAAMPEAADRRFLLLSPPPAERIPDLVRAGARLGLFDFEGLDEIVSAANESDLTVPIHIKVETGVQRQGFTTEQLTELSERLKAASGLHVEGIYTHFANIEDTTDHTFARKQMKRFASARDLLAAQGINPKLVHSSCSAAAILFPETHHDLLRLGISLYGHWPSTETRVSAQAAGRNRLDLQPVLTWKTRISQVKEVQAGSFVGYGCTWRAETDTRLGILPVGYSDGYDRGLGAAHVLVRGRRAPVRGRIMMNLLLVDLGHIPEARRGDEVVLIGRQGADEITAETLAGLAGTINYEILTRINPLLPRLPVD